MNTVIKEDILSALSEAIKILKVKEEKDLFELKELSNHTIHNSSIFQDEDSISTAILIYSLSKLLSRNFKEENYEKILDLLENAYLNLKKELFTGYRKDIKKIFKLISQLDSKIKLYVQEVIKQAQVRKGGQLYKHGISLARAAEILGVSQWELMDYVGSTQISDKNYEKTDIKSRIEFTRRLFS